MGRGEKGGEVAALAAVEPKDEAHTCAQDSAVKTPVQKLKVRFQYRDQGINDAHVEALAALEGEWPPILVTRDHAVIDGAHRLCAARSIGLRYVDCIFFDGSNEGAYEEFVRRNSSNGLPLTLAERKRACLAFLEWHPEWSDRRVGRFCGLSPRTVAAYRQNTSSSDERLSAQTAQCDIRVGRDGISRPIDSQLVARRVAEAIDSNPNGSLRSIARAANVAPETVRRAKLRMAREEAHPHSEASTTQASGALPTTNGKREWVKDSALISSSGTADLASWLDATSGCNSWMEYVSVVPLSRVYELADEARKRAVAWRSFADALERRGRGR